MCKVTLLSTAGLTSRYHKLQCRASHCLYLELRMSEYVAWIPSSAGVTSFSGECLRGSPAVQPHIMAVQGRTPGLSANEWCVSH